MMIDKRTGLPGRIIKPILPAEIFLSQIGKMQGRSLDTFARLPLI